MAYEFFKKVLTKKEYFDKYKQHNDTKNLTKDIANAMYKKYLLKCKVFKRDNYSCQNLNCNTPKSPLTLHHVKWKKNGGKDTERNCITLCHDCHKKFHSGRIEVTLSENKNIPSFIRGQTFKLSKSDNRMSKKILRKKAKEFRKSVKGDLPKITYELLKILFKWLENSYEDD